jgi:hypothetical protein
MPLVDDPASTSNRRVRGIAMDPIGLACARKAEKSARKHSIEHQMRLGGERMKALEQELLIVNRDLEMVDRDIFTLYERRQPHDRDNRVNSANSTHVVLYHSDSSKSSHSIETELSE